MLGGYQIIDFKGLELIYDLDYVTTISSQSKKISGMYELYKSLGSKPVLVENLKITFVRSSEGTLDSITETIGSFNTPFFAQYFTDEYSGRIILRLYTAFFDIFLRENGVSVESSVIYTSVGADDVVNVTI